MDALVFIFNCGLALIVLFLSLLMSDTIVKYLLFFVSLLDSNLEQTSCFCPTALCYESIRTYSYYCCTLNSINTVQTVAR